MKLIRYFIAIVIVIAIFELLLWIHGCIELHTPIDTTGVTTLTVWATVLTVVFLVFSVLGLLNIDTKVKELRTLKEEVTETNTELKQQIRELKLSAREERQKIIDKANEEVLKIMNNSRKRQNIYDRLTQIAGMQDPVYQIKNYTEILKNHTQQDGINESFILCRRGEAHQALKHYDEALRDFNEAIRKDPTSAEGYIVKGVFYAVSKEDYTKSIECFQKALDLDPSQTAMYGNIATSYSKMGEYEKAEEYYSKARDYNVEDAAWYYNKSLKIKEEGIPDPSGELKEGYLLQSLRINPMFYKSAINLANLYQERGEYSRSYDLLSRLISQGLNPDLHKAVATRGMAMKLSGLPSIAVLDFEWAFQLNPYDLYTIENIVRCKMSVGDLSGAAQYSEFGLAQADVQDQHASDQVFQYAIKTFKEHKETFDRFNKQSSDPQK